MLIERRQLRAIPMRLLEVPAEDLLDLEDHLARGGLGIGPLHEPLVELRASSLEQAGVRRVPDEDVVEAIHIAPRVVRLLVDEPAVFEAPDEFRVDRTPNNHVAFGVGVHFCLGAPLARMELTESLTTLFARYPSLALSGEPESRGTFVLRGYHRVPVRNQTGG